MNISQDDLVLIDYGDSDGAISYRVVMNLEGDIKLVPSDTKFKPITLKIFAPVGDASVDWDSLRGSQDKNTCP